MTTESEQRAELRRLLTEWNPRSGAQFGCWSDEEVPLAWLHAAIRTTLNQLDAAEAALERVRALVDEADSRVAGPGVATPRWVPTDALRAALDGPAEAATRLTPAEMIARDNTEEDT